MLNTCTTVEVHHEYLCEYIQPLGVLRFANKISTRAAIDVIQRTHGAAVALCKHSIWIDSSNKLTWLVPELLEIFPNAKFVNIIRDGRKVAGSFFRKLSHEMYDDLSVNALKAWLADPDRNVMPPPEKKYWWNIPLHDQPFADEFPHFDHFQRCVYHWVESNRIAKNACDFVIPKSQSFSIKLEELVQASSMQRRLAAFIGIDFDPCFSDLLQRPENVIVPIDMRLSKHQLLQFEQIAGKMMDVLGYSMDSEEYRVDYR